MNLINNTNVLVYLVKQELIETTIPSIIGSLRLRLSEESDDDFEQPIQRHRLSASRLKRPKLRLSF